MIYQGIVETDINTRLKWPKNYFYIQTEHEIFACACTNYGEHWNICNNLLGRSCLIARDDENELTLDWMIF